jgi:hypothetical protein
MKKIFIPSCGLILLFNLQLHSQTSTFDINAYKQFLVRNQNLTTTQILNMHPAGTFQSRAYGISSTPLYLDSITVKYSLTDYERDLITKHGFMVTERLNKKSFGEAFLDIYHKDLPVFVSTDAILHALHMSYNLILKMTEVQILIPKLGELLSNLHAQIPLLASTYLSDTSMIQMLKDVDVYLTVPRKLLGQTAQPYYPSNISVVNKLIIYINQEKPQLISLFSSIPRKVDFSQFKVRGHYTDINYPQLAKYFKAMMWLGRIEIYLLPPRSFDAPPTFEDIQRQTIDALLILEAAKLGSSIPLLNEIDDIIKFFVGESDNVTLPNINELAASVNVVSANQLLNNSTLLRFQDSLKTKSYAFQRILSQILCSHPMYPDSIIPASSFLLLGQRFIIDSYVAGQVVYDRIKFNGEKIKRLIPSTLDILFALGNDASLQLLKSELDTYKYGTNLAGLRYLIDAYETDFWEVSFYNLWLNSIRELNPPSAREGLPPFMKTAAWWQEKMNTQLASWSQLRHDNLLYAKQSYTGGVVCSFPYTYVEPIPKFYSAIKRLAQISETKFQSIAFPNSNIKSEIVNYFKEMKGIADTLGNISTKELNGTLFSIQEKNFLKKVIYDTIAGCAPAYLGWYPKLYFLDYGMGNELLKEDMIVADVHTTPTDVRGFPVGWVLHGGTGKVNLGVFSAQIPEGQTIAFVGPVMSYHEYTSTNFLRLTDEEWKASYLRQSSRPSFVNLYLADSTGSSRGTGINLLTSSEEYPPPQIPQSIVLEQNYPNPFNPSTVISYQLSAVSYVTLKVYDVLGREVVTLVNEEKLPGDYKIEFDASRLTSGVYFYRLSTGKFTSVKKMLLLR